MAKCTKHRDEGLTNQIITKVSQRIHPILTTRLFLALAFMATAGSAFLVNATVHVAAAWLVL